MTTIRYPILILAVFVALSCVASAAPIVISANQTGTSYIEWKWGSGYNITTIILDGVEICGYETTANTSLQSGLSPNSFHTINITDGVNIGYASGYTLPEPPSGSTDPIEMESIAAAFGLIGGSIGVVMLKKRRDKN